MGDSQLEAKSGRGIPANLKRVLSNLVRSVHPEVSLAPKICTALSLFKKKFNFLLIVFWKGLYLGTSVHMWMPWDNTAELVLVGSELCHPACVVSTLPAEPLVPFSLHSPVLITLLLKLFFILPSLTPSLPGPEAHAILELVILPPPPKC